jgi:hypothetical protein
VWVVVSFLVFRQSWHLPNVFLCYLFLPWVHFVAVWNGISNSDYPYHRRLLILFLVSDPKQIPPFLMLRETGSKILEILPCRQHPSDFCIRRKPGKYLAFHIRDGRSPFFPHLAPKPLHLAMVTWMQTFRNRIKPIGLGEPSLFVSPCFATTLPD